MLMLLVRGNQTDRARSTQVSLMCWSRPAIGMCAPFCPSGLIEHSPNLLGLTPQVIIARYKMLQAWPSAAAPPAPQPRALLFPAAARIPCCNLSRRSTLRQAMFDGVDVRGMVYKDSGLLSLSSRYVVVKFLLLRSARPRISEVPRFRAPCRTLSAHRWEPGGVLFLEEAPAALSPSKPP